MTIWHPESNWRYQDRLCLAKKPIDEGHPTSPACASRYRRGCLDNLPVARSDDHEDRPVLKELRHHLEARTHPIFVCLSITCQTKRESALFLPPQGQADWPLTSPTSTEEYGYQTRSWRGFRACVQCDGSSGSSAAHCQGCPSSGKAPGRYL